jgi:outer membrane protein TolC
MNQVNRQVAPSGSLPAPMLPSSMGSSSSSSGLSDLYRIQMEFGELDNNIALLKNQERTVIARFNSYLNRSPLHPVYVDTVLNRDSSELADMVFHDTLLTNNPVLNMLNYEKQSFDARKKMVEGMSYPMIGLGINYSLINRSAMSSSAMNGTDMVMPMVTVTLPVYRKKYNAMKNEADLLKSAAELNYQATVNSLHTEYYSAFQLYQDALLKTKLYENQHILAS